MGSENILNSSKYFLVDTDTLNSWISKGKLYSSSFSQSSPKIKASTINQKALLNFTSLKKTYNIPFAIRISVTYVFPFCLTSS